LETLKCTNDITAGHGSLRALTLYREKNLLLAACEKTIMIWDALSLNNIGLLKSKEDIRAIQVSSDG